MGLGVSTDEFMNEPGFPARSRDGQKRYILLHAEQSASPGSAGSAVGQVRTYFGRQTVGARTMEKPTLDDRTVHTSSLFICGASTRMSFCLALKTRQRAVSSLI